MPFNKILRYLKSWNNLDLKKDYESIIFGPAAKNQIDYFEKNFCYIDPLRSNIYNLNLFISGIFFFIYYFIKKPFIFIKLFKFWPTIFFVISLIKRKNIKIIISLVDYNPWPRYLKKIFDNEIKIIAVQNSMRAYPIDRMKFLNNFDVYFLWNELSSKEIESLNNSTELHKLGALKSLALIEKNNKWDFVKTYPSKAETEKKIFLISSYQSFHCEFYKKFFPNLEKINLESELKKINTEKFNRIELQCLEYLIMCDYLNYFIKNRREYKIQVIERCTHDDPLYNDEIQFFNTIFKNPEILKKNRDERINTVLKNKNAVYLTNTSNLGYECFAMNLKTLFFSKYLHKIHSNFYHKENIFFSIEENKEQYSQRLNHIINMDSNTFEKNKKFTNKSGLTCEPKKENLNTFLKETNLKLI